MSPLKTKLKGFAAAGLALSSTIGLAVAPNTFAEGSSSFFDANAAQCVVDSYNATSGLSVTTIEEVDLNSVTALNCANRNITHFRGIVLFPNLTWIDLTNNTNLAVDYMDFSQNTKLKFVSLYNAGNYYSLDLSNSPDIESLYIRPINGAMPTITLAKGVKKLDDGSYGFDLNDYKWWSNIRSHEDYLYKVEIDESAYPYTLDWDTNKLVFADKTKIPYSVATATPYGDYYIRTRTGYMNYRLFFEGDEEIETHNPITINNNCEARDGYGYNGGIYYYCNNTVYEGDEIDTNAIRTNYLDKIFNLANYELSKVEIVPPTANVELSIDTDIQKKGIILGDANFTLDFHFAIKSNDAPSTPSTPDTGLFTKDDGSANVENILLSLACLSVIAFLVLGISHRLSLKSRTRKF